MSKSETWGMETGTLEMECQSEKCKIKGKRLVRGREEYADFEGDVPCPACGERLVLRKSKTIVIVVDNGAVEPVLGVPEGYMVRIINLDNHPSELEEMTYKLVMLIEEEIGLEPDFEDVEAWLDEAGYDLDEFDDQPEVVLSRWMEQNGHEPGAQTVKVMVANG